MKASLLLLLWVIVLPYGFALENRPQWMKLYSVREAKEIETYLAPNYFDKKRRALLRQYPEQLFAHFARQMRDEAKNYLKPKKGEPLVPWPGPQFEVRSRE